MKPVVIWSGNLILAVGCETTRVVMTFSVEGETELIVEHQKTDAVGDTCWKEDRLLTKELNDDESFIVMVLHDVAIGLAESIPP
ncbi:hypothetical protein LCGC14_0702070 [marine sediment metagenome]|uniref:Uncharacterized protein n=1 Tax=marine sediment metagenome TaxID=412755 RepID=A0A0F9QHJ0_9ZZZZ